MAESVFPLSVWLYLCGICCKSFPCKKKYIMQQRTNRKIALFYGITKSAMRFIHDLAKMKAYYVFSLPIIFFRPVGDLPLGEIEIDSDQNDLLTAWAVFLDVFLLADLIHGGFRILV